MSLKVLSNAYGYIDLSDFWWRDGEKHREQILTFQIFLTLLLFELQPFKVEYRFFLGRTVHTNHLLESDDQEMLCHPQYFN